MLPGQYICELSIYDIVYFEPLGTAPTLASLRAHLLKKWVTADIPLQGTCKWLTVSSTELCSKSCLTDFCKVHLGRLRKGSRTQPCRGCGVGVTNKQQLCCQCGYRSEWSCATRAMRKEFARLAAIQISI